MTVSVTENTSWWLLTPGHTCATSVWTTPWYSGSVLPYHCCRDLDRHKYSFKCSLGAPLLNILANAMPLHL